MMHFTFKPKNWDCCVDAVVNNNDPRSTLIYDAYERGKRLRLDSPGMSIARDRDVVPINYIAIDGGTTDGDHNRLLI